MRREAERVWKWVDLLAKQNSVSSQAQQVFCSKGPTTELPTAEGHFHREQRRLGITSNYEARSQVPQQTVLVLLSVQAAASGIPNKKNFVLKLFDNK